MTFEQAMVARILASPAAQELGASVDWDDRPQGHFPAVVLTIASDRRGRTMKGWQGARPVRVQLDVMALSRGDRIRLREGVILAIGDAGTFDGVAFSGVRDLAVRSADDGGGPDRVYRDIIDAVFWHSMT